MFIIQQRKSMCRTVLLTVLIEIVFVNKSISSEAICRRGNMRNISYFQADIAEVDWIDAGIKCRSRNATLPVICNQEEQTALAAYLKANMGISDAWTSGRKSPLNEWTWVNGRAFDSRAMIHGEKLHTLLTHVTLNQSGMYNAQDPRNKVYYLCQYSGSSCSSPNVVNVTNGCVVPSNYDLPWYHARNQCLMNGGDLAILENNDLVAFRNSERLNRVHRYWIGLRKNAWAWIGEASVDATEKVEYSNWSTDEHSLDGECISIDALKEGWMAVRCTVKKRVVCQAILGRPTVETTSSTSSPMTTSTPKTTSKLSSTISSSRLNTRTGSVTTMSESSPTYNSSTMILVYSGLGAGIAIIIICIIVIIAVRYKMSHKRIDHSNDNRKSDQSVPDQFASSSANPPASAPVKAPETEVDDMRGIYAEVSLSGLTQSQDVAKQQQTEQSGLVYASLEFQKEPNNMEPGQKPTNGCNPTKVGPMGDIYAMPDAKSHAINSSGNQSTSHPIKVAPKGDNYALAVKDSKSSATSAPVGRTCIYSNM